MSTVFLWRQNTRLLPLNTINESNVPDLNNYYIYITKSVFFQITIKIHKCSHIVKCSKLINVSLQSENIKHLFDIPQSNISKWFGEVFVSLANFIEFSTFHIIMYLNLYMIYDWTRIFKYLQFKQPIFRSTVV